MGAETLDDPAFPRLINNGGLQINWSQREILIFRMLFETGARISEILGLTLADWVKHGCAETASTFSKGSSNARVPVTKYYAEPTLSVVAHHHERIGENLFHSLNLEVESKRLPDEMVTLYQTAKSTSRTLTEVLGGTCTSHGQCPAKTACVGCAAKIPDPAKRAVIERKMEWALNEKAWNHENGFGAEERKMDVLIRDCKTELLEMEQIQIYMQSRGDAVQVFDSEQVPLKWVGNPEVSA